MTFAAPYILWFLVLPVAWFVWEVTIGRRVAVASSRPKILRAEIGQKELSVVRDPAGPAASRIRPWLTLGHAFAIVALARPQWGRIEEPVYDQSREILLAIDLSRSMLAPDVKPSRLDRAKLLVQSLLEKLKGERVGLIVFSGTAFLQSPLSSDYEILREFLPALGPDFLPEGGTNYRALIDTALDAFGTSGAADRFVIILSDGEATDDEWASRVTELKNKGVRVIGLGIGTSNGTMIPDGSGGFVKDSRGAVVMSKLESSTLQSLANSTSGVYRDASSWIDLASLIDETVNTGKKGAFTETNTVRYVDRFQWPLALALWCFLLSFYYEFPVKPRPRDIPLRSEKRSNQLGAKGPIQGAALGLLLMLLACLVSPQATHAAVKVAPPASAPTTATGSPTEPAAALGRIVNRLSQKEDLNAVDISELAHETLNWGRRLKDSGTQVPPGPVHDALAGLDQIEAQGNKLADWDQLRKDLEALLQRPPPPPKQQQQQQQQQQNDQQKDQQQKQDKSDQNKQDQSDQKQSQSPQDQKPEEQKQNQSAFGDMSKPPPPPQQQQQGETQKVGGAPEKKQEQTDPSMAMPMEKLEQLKNQDSPSQLFQMMQADRSQASRKKPQKDW